MSGALLLAAVFGAAACNNVTSDLAGGPTTIQVDHNPLLLTKGKSGLLVVQNYDNQGSPLVSNAEVVGAPTGPISIAHDTGFQHGGIHYGTQFIISGLDFGVGTATFTDAGLTTALDTVVIIPNDTNPIGVLSTTTPSVGDTVSITISGQFRFDATSIVTVDGRVFAGGVLTDTVKTAVAERVDVSADSLTLRFLAPDTIQGPRTLHYNSVVSLTKIGYQFSPAYPFGLLGSFGAQTTTNLVLP
ncbi:MAG: hypothetical protein ABI765_11105 [Gemmatimonadota bacterium]